MSGNSDRAAWQVTTDREQIRQWADGHDVVPLRAEETDGNDLRLLSEPEDGRGEPLSWDEFFERFEARSLALRYRETDTRGQGQPAYEFVDRDEIVDEAVEGQETPGNVEAHTHEDDRGDVSDDQPTPPGNEGSGATQVDSETVARSGDSARHEDTPTTDADDDAADRETDTAMSGSSHGAELGAFVLDEIHETHGLTDGVDEEYVTFRNTSEDALDLSEWVVENDDGERFVFPEGFELDAGQHVTLHSGSGTDSETDVYWGVDSEVWDDAGDTITVRTPDGREVLQEPYGK